MPDIRNAVKYKTLVEAILDKPGNNKGIHFIMNREKEFFLSYDALLKKALHLLCIFQEKGLQPGEQLVFQVEDNCDFVTAYWACLLGKIIPVPVTVGNNDEYRLKLLNIWEILDKPHLIASKKFLENLEGFASQKNLEEIFVGIAANTVFSEEIGGSGEEGAIHMPDAHDLAFIQFSSGSTGTPKGVALTHKNLMTNTLDIAAAMEYGETDKMLSWMPLTHDMGMIGFHLTPLVVDWEQVLMPPQLFLRYPALWLQTISQTGATITSSPNFGYKYVLKHFSPETYRDVDLSALRIIVNGAEPISAPLCREFLAALAPYGLAETAMCPAYGLAEATVAVTFFPPGEPLTDVTVDRRNLNCGEKIKEIPANGGGNGGDSKRGGSGNGSHAVSFVDVGVPVKECRIDIIDDDGNSLDDDFIGHIRIHGDNVTSGYYNNEAATSQTITPAGWLETGDLGFRRKGRLYITGRGKEILFVNGQNYYPHDIERVAEELEGVEHGKIVVCDTVRPGQEAAQAVAFVVAKRISADFLDLADRLKFHIAGQAGLEIDEIVPVKQIPKTTSGKAQRVKLKTMYQDGHYDDVLGEIETLREETGAGKPTVTERELKEQIADVWKHVLDIQQLGFDENFFELGGNSFFALRVKVELEKWYGGTLDEAVLFKHPTVNALSRSLSGEDEGPAASLHRAARERRKKRPFLGQQKSDGSTGLEIAVIGMAGRFPGAGNIDGLWENLQAGVESISFFSQEELMESGLPEEAVKHPDYVKAKGILDSCEYFDASFFGYMPAEAEKMDPQMRIFHECAWESLEDAGYDPGNYEGRIGVYVGASPNHRWEVRSFQPHAAGADEFTGIQFSDKDFLATRISYKFNLRGPAFSLFAACSTSLAAVDLACWGIISGKCDMALAGGVSIWLPVKFGYLHEEGMIFSSDGHTRAFDARADGTLFSDGAGICLLKGLQEALDDGDNIYAVIKGTATNNDGSRKAGYSAPSLEGQAEAVIDAQLMAGVSPETIGYIEAHGTGTAIGDPLEVDALKMAFNTDKKGFCALGSIKTNIGHLNAAAGIAGLIKAVLAIKYRRIPPTLFYTAPNPRIDFENSPFYVNTELKEWNENRHPLRAGVSSYGIGGTNAHVVLEEAPQIPPAPRDQKHRLLLLSARSKGSVDRAVDNLAAHLRKHPGIDLADVAYTLQIGRKAFHHRVSLVCSTVDEAVAALSGTPGDGGGMRYANPSPRGEKPKILFMFPGQGSQYVDMGRDLYGTEPFFRHQVDRCFQILEQRQGLHLKTLLYPPPGEISEEDGQKINRTEITQPLLFIIEYALARLLVEWGIRPDAMIGHSIGEYAAACLSGVFSLEDALALVSLRGRLMQRVAPGAMVSVALPVEKVTPFLNDGLSVAAVNGPGRCVISGPFERVERLERQLEAEGIDNKRLYTSHAFHSQMMNPVLAEFGEAVRERKTNAPQIPFISNITGKPITPAEAMSPGYWATHIRETVRFADGIGELLKEENAVFIEVGPGNVLSTFTRQQREKNSRQAVVNLVRRPKDTLPDDIVLLRGVGQLWGLGVDIDWTRFQVGSGRRRISLPTYSFDGRKFDKLLNGPFGAPSIYHQKSERGNGDGDTKHRSSPKAVQIGGPGARHAGGVKAAPWPAGRPLGEPPEADGSTAEEPSETYSRPILSTSYVPARSEREKILVRVWEDFFGIDGIGVQDDFFELGGDSLQAVNILRQIRGKTNVNIPLKELFQLGNIEKTAQFIDRSAGAQSAPHLTIEKAEVKPYYPLSRSQAAIYGQQQKDPGDLSYNEFLVMTLEGEPDIGRIEETFKKLIRRHEVFRTSFTVVDGVPVQRVHEDVPFAVDYSEAHHPEPDPGVLVKESIRPFDLNCPPLLRVFLIKTGAARYLLVIDIHNIVIDGVSSGIVLKDFNRLYSGEEPAACSLQYKDYAVWQQTFLHSETVKEQEKYWLDRFSGDLPGHALPTDYPRPPLRYFHGKNLDFEMDDQLSRKVKEFSVESGGTLYMVLMAFYFILLAKYSGGDDLLVGTPVAGRNSDQLNDVVGMFSNVVLMRNSVEPGQRFRQFITEVIGNTFQAFENQDYRFEDLVETVGVKREDGPPASIYDTLFAMEVFEASLFDMPGLEVRPYDYDGGNCRIPLRITAADSEGKIKMRIRYAVELFKEETIGNMAKHYVEIVKQVLADTAVKIGDIRLS